MPGSTRLPVSGVSRYDRRIRTPEVSLPRSSRRNHRYVIDRHYVNGVQFHMVFIETPIFTADVRALLGDDDYAALQQHLVVQPNAGAVIAGTGGLRKIRWTTAGRGKRGGTRVIYYHVVAQAQIRMILIYRKGIKDDLTPREKAELRKINSEW